MFKRIRNMWQLSRKDPAALKTLENLTPEQLAEVPEVPDGQAVYFGEGTKEEFKEQERKDSGMKGWYDRLRNL